MAQAALKSSLTYERDIRPILKANCFQCHGEGEKLKGDLDVRLRHLIAKGGEHGAAIVAGKPEKSLLFTQVRDGEMPKADKKLTKAEIETIRQWIASGAKTARPEPKELGKEPYFTEDERSYWFFQPVKRPEVPKVRNTKLVRTPVDAFLLKQIEAQKLSFAPEADRRTLIRRATFDLTGLPPTPEEVTAFLADESPQAYEQLIDRLLASPRYGEHWGRHWLDVAGYADSDGYNEADTERKYSYKFRDYVIRAFNDDKPFDQFIREQLAGDEMVKPPYKNLPPDSIEKLVATGFLRMAPDGTASGEVEQKISRNHVVADTLKIVSTSLMGLTVGCAECHDHRYDPIPQADYYRLRAVFEPAYDWKNWRAPAARSISLMTDTERAKAAGIEKEAAKIDAARTKRQQEFIDEVLEKELEEKDAGIRDALRIAYRTETKKRTPEQVKLLKEHPTIAQLTSGSLYLYDRTYKTKHADELKKLTEEAAKIREKKPAEDFVNALTEVPGKIPETFLFHRGDPDQPKQKLEPAELTILASWRPTKISATNAVLPTTGRRLTFAQHLTDGAHPLTARVLVNRVWLNHFGRGIVASPGDFGFLGQRPTHPELLDWLASEFVSQGWSMKKLHKLLMTSAAYRQSSVRDPKKDRLDPDNRLYARMTPRRLEAETVRDAILAVSGKLNDKMFGPPVPVMEDEVGQVIIGKENKDGEGKVAAKIDLKGDEFRRSIYVQVRRSRPLGMLEAFDAPVMEPNCEARNASTVAPQSLMLMNNTTVVEYAGHFAECITKDAGQDAAAQVKRAWWLCFAREPGKTELEKGVTFLNGQTDFFRDQIASAKTKPKETAEQQALANFCHALLSANEFLYVD
ncbi:MAG: PSD1 domain-containing protein [Verrucomicrobia bacterium]|nr:PSD1 domain-containing protein [Verrucomicrobiota bacterium]